jgi:hypothetical protein
VNQFDLLEQQCVFLNARRIGPADPVVINRARHIEHPAGHRDINIVVGKFADQRED